MFATMTKEVRDDGECGVRRRKKCFTGWEEDMGRGGRQQGRMQEEMQEKVGQEELRKKRL